VSEVALDPAGVGRRFKRYPAYKDSGVEWLGEIPAHWEVKRLWHLTPSGRRIMYGIVLPGPNVDEGVPIVKGGDVSADRLRLERLNQTSFEIESGYARSRLRGGDLVYAIRGSIGEVALVPDELDGANLTQDAARIACTSATYGPWLLYALKSAEVFAQLEAGALGATIRGVNIRDLKRASIPVPPLGEQHAIAKFVECETVRIDTLVAKKERLIDLLREKRTALITRAVTKGLDANVPMKDSGIEWLGEIPTHWQVKRLWHLTPSGRRIMYGIVLPGPHVDEGVPIVKGGDVSPDRLQLDRLNRTSFEIESGYARSRLRGGDLVYAIRGSIGEVAVVPDELEGANLTQDAARIAYTPATSGPWLLYALKSAAVFAQLEAGALGATIRGVNIRDLKRASIPVPPPSEQQVIARFLERETATVDGLLTKIREAINGLKELRAALISAAVTGRIDVRGA
jgi:type I restriction enzyme, S subunit